MFCESYLMLFVKLQENPATYKASVCLKPRQRQYIRAKAVHITDCVCLPAQATQSYERGYTVCA